MHLAIYADSWGFVEQARRTTIPALRLEYYSLQTFPQNDMGFTAFYRSEYIGRIEQNFYLFSTTVIQIFQISKFQSWALQGSHLHTSYLSRTPRIYSCNFFLAGVNFYRFNAKNWQFSVYFVVIYAFFRCKFYSPKILLV